MSRRWLAPFTPFYAAALALRNRRIEDGSEPVRRLRSPVVSIGNLSTGGAGKTPLTIALARALTLRGLQVDVLSRGYGRAYSNPAQIPVRVVSQGTAEEFGDEPLLIAREAAVPVYVAQQRFDAGLLAEATAEQPAEKRCLVSGHDFSRAVEAAKSTGALAPEGCFSGNLPATRCLSPSVGAPPDFPVVHLLDDGFQHRQLHREVDILLLDRQDWQDSLLPAGNLREPRRAIRRATSLALPADDPALEAELKSWGWQGPVWRLRRTMQVPTVDGPVAAFCGIARPRQFFAGLEAAGLELAARKAFPDHHRYTAADLERLVTSAHAAGATALVTTEKDQVRLGKLCSAFPEALPLKTAGLRIEIEQEDQAINWLVGRLSPVPQRPPL